MALYECSRCAGSGEDDYGNLCYTCGGEGVVADEEPEWYETCSNQELVDAMQRLGNDILELEQELQSTHDIDCLRDISKDLTRQQDLLDDLEREATYRMQAEEAAQPRCDQAED